VLDMAYRGCWISEVGASARGRVRDREDMSEGRI